MAYETIAGVDVVREHLGDPSWVIVDCRHALVDFALGRRLYDEAHVPGAFFADAETDLAGHKTGRNGRHPMPDPHVFARFLQGLGVDDSTQLIAYDAGGDMFAARLWFLSRWIGHDAVAVMDGGIGAWTAAGYPVTAAPSEPDHDGTIGVELRHHYLVDAGYVLGHLDSDAIQLLDARAADRFAGQNEMVDPIAGHIPGARNRWFKEAFNADGTFKSPEQLRAELQGHVVDPRRIVHNCGSGVSAAVNHLSMVHAGMEGSRIYGGSWSEWIADPSRPIATGEHKPK